jgi:hypothetical protein
MIVEQQGVACRRAECVAGKVRYGIVGWGHDAGNLQVGSALGALSADLKTKIGIFNWKSKTASNWNTAANWTQSAIPAGGETALITSVGSYTVSTTSNVSVAAVSTVAGVSLLIGGGTVSIW